MSHRDYIERFFIVRVKGDETLCRELVSEAYFNILTAAATRGAVIGGTQAYTTRCR